MGVDAHLSDSQNRAAAGFPVFPEHNSVFCLLGQRLNKRKPLISTFAEMRGFRFRGHGSIACY